MFAITSLPSVKNYAACVLSKYNAALDFAPCELLEINSSPITPHIFTIALSFRLSISLSRATVALTLRSEHNPIKVSGLLYREDTQPMKLTPEYLKRVIYAPYMRRIKNTVSPFLLFRINKKYWGKKNNKLKQKKSIIKHRGIEAFAHIDAKRQECNFT